MPLQRRDLLKLGAAAVLAPACATPRRDPAPDDARTRAYNAVLLASPGDLEHSVAAGDVEGEIPAELRGARYLLNGPGKLKYGDQIIHPFDGHGYARAFRFNAAGGVDLKARFVQTSCFVDEEKAGRLLYPGIGTRAEKKAVRNVANTTILPFNGELLVGWEGGAPHALGSESLKTLRTERFGGLIEQDQAFLAHMRIDPPTGRLVGLMPTQGMSTKLRFVELSAEGKKLGEREADVGGAMFIHDFVVTPRYYVLSLNPIKVDLVGFLGVQSGKKTLLDVLDGDNKREGELVLIPRAGRTGRVRRVKLGAPTFVVHYGNAFDDGDDVVVDYAALPAVSFGQEFGYDGPDRAINPAIPDEREPQRLLRARVKPDDSVDLRQIATYHLDFPRVNTSLEGRRAPALYAGTRADGMHSDPFDAIVKVDLDDLERPEAVFAPGRGRLVGEPVFAPKPGAGPDDGWVIHLVYDGALRETQLVVLDAADLKRGPVASARFPLLPYGFHGWFEPATPAG
jgi:carotenoid cleavage dioxygenase-like enzyme